MTLLTPEQDPVLQKTLNDFFRGEGRFPLETLLTNFLQADEPTRQYVAVRMEDHLFPGKNPEGQFPVLKRCLEYTISRFEYAHQNGVNTTVEDDADAYTAQEMVDTLRFCVTVQGKKASPIAQIVVTEVAKIPSYAKHEPVLIMKALLRAFELYPEWPEIKKQREQEEARAQELAEAVQQAGDAKAQLKKAQGVHIKINMRHKP